MFEEVFLREACSFLNIILYKIVTMVNANVKKRALSVCVISWVRIGNCLIDLRNHRLYYFHSET